MSDEPVIVRVTEDEWVQYFEDLGSQFGDLDDTFSSEEEPTLEDIEFIHFSDQIFLKDEDEYAPPAESELSEDDTEWTDTDWTDTE
jgi:hypothetical protein